MTIKEKILTFLDAEGIKKSDFFEAVGVVPSNFKGAAKHSELGGDKIAKILAIYPQLSAEWLMRGKGNMILEDVESRSQEDKKMTFQSPSTSDPNPFIDRLISMIAEKDSLIRIQAEEIGQLKERVVQSEQEKNESMKSFQPAQKEFSTSQVD